MDADKLFVFSRRLSALIGGWAIFSFFRIRLGMSGQAGHAEALRAFADGGFPQPGIVVAPPPESHEQARTQRPNCQPARLAGPSFHS